MPQVDIYHVDPASIAHGHLIGLFAIGVTALLASLLVARFGWRCWWALILLGIAVPTIVIATAGGAFPDATRPPTEYVSDVVLPLALIGLPASAVGSLLGAAARWVLRRNCA